MPWAPPEAEAWSPPEATPQPDWQPPEAEHEAKVNSLIDSGVDLPGHAAANPQDEDAAWEAYKRQQTRPFIEKAASAAGELVKPENYGNALAGVAKFGAGVLGTGIHSALGAAENYTARVANAVGADKLAEDAARRATTNKAESVLAGQTVEEGLKNTVEKIAGPVRRGIAQFNDYRLEEPLLREKFDQAKQRSARMQQLAQGRPLDSGVVAALTRISEGMPPSEAFSPEALENMGAAPASPLVTESIAAGADPTNLVLAKAGTFPGANKVGGAVAQGVGKVLKAPGAVIDAATPILRHMGTAGRAAAGVGVTEAAILHPLASAKLLGAGLATRYGAKAGQWAGEAIDQAGRTMRTGVEGPIARRAAADLAETGKIPIGARAQLKLGQGVTGATGTAAGMIPLHLIESEGEPDEVAKGTISAAVFGGALGAGHSLEPQIIRAQQQRFSDYGAQRLSDNPLYDAHEAKMATFSPDDQAAINRLRALNHAGANTDLLVLDGNTFAQKAGQLGGDARGRYVEDEGTIFVNGDAFNKGSAGRTLDTANHETGHAIVNWLVDANRAADAQRMMQAIKENLTPEQLDDLTRSYRAALSQSTPAKPGETPEQRAAIYNNISEGTPLERDVASPTAGGSILDENLAEITRAILNGQDVSKFALPQSTKERITDAAARELEARGLAPKVAPDMRLGFKAHFVAEAARQMRGVLYELGKSASRRIGEGPSVEQNLQTLRERLDTIPPVTPHMSVEEAERHSKARAAIEAQIARWERRLAGETDTAVPPAASTTPEAATPRADAKAAAQARVDAAAALKAMGVGGAEAHAMINTANAQHGSAITDAGNLVAAVQRVRAGENIQPWEYGGGKTGPVTPIPTGRTFTTPTGKATITGHSNEPPKPGDFIITDKSEIRRYIGPSIDGRGINVAFSGTAGDRQPLFVGNGKFTVLTHDPVISTSAEAAPSAPTSSPAEPVSSAPTVTPQWTAKEIRPGVWQVIDQAGNPRSNKTFPNQAAAEQSVRQTGKKIPLAMGPGDTPDSLNHIADMGGIAAKKSTQEYDDMPAGIPTAILGGTITPEDAANALLTNHGIGDGTVSGLWAAIEKDMLARQRAKAGPTSNPAEKAPEGLEAKFAALAPELQDKLSRPDWDQIRWTHEEISAVNAALGEHSPFKNYQPESSEPAEPDWTIPDETNPPAGEPVSTISEEHDARDASHPDTTQSAPLREDHIRQIAAQAEETFLGQHVVKPEGLKLNTKAGKAWQAEQGGKKGLSADEHEKARRKAIVREVATAHAQTVPLNYEGIRLRVDPFGKESITGTVDPSRPFDAFLIEQAKQAGRWNENTDGILRELQDHIGQTVSYDYGHAPGDGDVAIRAGRESAQKAATARQRARGEAEQQVERKHSVPLFVQFNAGEGSFTVFGASPEKLLSNFNHVAEAVGQLGREVPYRDIHDPHLVGDIKQVIANHENGWKGDGSGKVEGSSVPEMGIRATEGYRPQYVIPKERFEFLNMMLGDESAKSSRPEAKPKMALAAENRTLVTSEGETNELRHAINEKLGIGQWGKTNSAGKPVESTWSAATIENPLSEQIAADLVHGIHPETSRDDASIRTTGYRGELGRFFDKGKTPDRTFAAAGFQPAEDTGKPGESDIPSENLTREAEVAGVTLSLDTIKKLIARDPETMAAVRRRIEVATGRPAQFQPQERPGPREAARARQRERQHSVAIGNAKMTPGAQFLPMPLHHGTPHEVDKFRTDKIGTGEGAQSYGHGLYFAENPKVAETYQSQLSAWSLRDKDGNRINTDGLSSEAKKLIAEGPDGMGSPDIKRWHEAMREDAARALSWAEQGKNPEGNRAFAKGVEEVIKATENAVHKPGGNVYTVRIKPDHDAFLDWDKPLSQQSDAVQAALAKLDADSYSKDGADYDANEPGQVTYHRLWKNLIRTAKAEPAKDKQKAASEKLANLGISGIRYRDEGSRHPGEPIRYEFDNEQQAKANEKLLHDSGTFSLKVTNDGDKWILEGNREPTHNFVIFNDADIEITHKNGEPVTPAERQEATGQHMPSESTAPKRQDRPGSRPNVRALAMQRKRDREAATVN